MGDGHRSRVLVTGGSGFTGRRGERALLAAADAVTVADKRPFPGDAIDMVLPHRCDPSVLRFSNVYGPGSVTVNDMVAASRIVTGKELPVTYVPAEPGETPAVIVDISRQARSIGYVPEQDLKSGLATVWPEFAEATQ
jgi:nucleoside-diphosphate-sugar epimerase